MLDILACSNCLLYDNFICLTSFVMPECLKQLWAEFQHLIIIC